jgi:hypothetical protein
MSYAITDFSATELEFNDGLRSYFYKKCYCSVELQGEYIIFTAHRVENNAFRQQFSVAYTDFTTPSGSSSAVLAAIQVIIDSYASGGAGVDTVTATSPITSTGGSNPNISSNVNKNRLIGRNPVTAGVMEEISIGSGLTLSGTTLSNTATPTPTGYYGMWQDNVTQTAPSSNVGLAMIFRTTDLSNGVTVVTNGTNLTRITFANTGIYNLQFSSQFQNVDNALHDVTIWLRLNGSDVAGSSGFISVPQRKNPSDPGHLVVSWNYLLDVVAGQYYELYWSTTNHTNVVMKAYSAGSPPPSTASVILTVTQQAGIMAGTGITAINSLTGAAQTLVAGTSGTDFAVSSVGTAHTLNLPTASATNRGALSSADWSTFNGKTTSPWEYRLSGRFYTPSTNALAIGSLGNLANSIRYSPIIIERDITITQLGISVVTIAGVGNTARVGIYTNNPATNQPSSRLVDSGTIALDGATGQRIVTGLSVVLTKGLYWLAYFSNASTGTVASIANLNLPDVIGTTGTLNNGLITGYTQSLTYTSLPATASGLGNILSGASSYCIYYYY